MDPFTLLALAVVAALIVIPFVVVEVKRRRRAHALDGDDGEEMRSLLGLVIPVLSPEELSASKRAERLRRERVELDDESPAS